MKFTYLEARNRQCQINSLVAGIGVLMFFFYAKTVIFVFVENRRKSIHQLLLVNYF